MPMQSQAQRRAMFAAKNGKSTLGIPSDVGAEFAASDTGGKLPSRVGAPKNFASHAQNVMKRKALAGTKPAKLKPPVTY